MIKILTTLYTVFSFVQEVQVSCLQKLNELTKRFKLFYKKKKKNPVSIQSQNGKYWLCSGHQQFSSEKYSIENNLKVVKKKQIFYILFILQIPYVKIIHQV